MNISQSDMQIRASIRKFVTGKITALKSNNLYNLAWAMAYDLTIFNEELADAETRNKITPKQRGELYSLREIRYRKALEEQFTQLPYDEQILFYVEITSAVQVEGEFTFVCIPHIRALMTNEQLTAAKLLM